MSGGGTNTIQTQSAPPQQYLDAYSNVTNQATQVASTPYQAYPGNTVAGLSPDQTSAIGEVENAQGIANPYINSAAGYINNSTTPLWSGVQQFSPSAVSQYESPYTQSVLNTTVAAENNQDAQQQAGIVGNAVSQGAFGGDRSAVAQGITAGQQAIANNQTNAGIENQGYTQALGEFNQQQTSQLGANQANAWLNSQAGYGMANLGNEAQSTTLSGANALLGTGGLEQTQAQSELNVPYQQYLAQQAYPFQTTGWLANIDEGLGGASGGTSSTTSPGASAASQLTGLGMAGAGLYGSGALSGIGSGIGSLFGAGAGMSGAMSAASAAGAFASEAAATAGSAGIASGAGEGLGLLATAARGGQIPHRDTGGDIPGSPVSWIPSDPTGGQHRGTMPQAPRQQATQPGIGDVLQSGLHDLGTTGAFGENGWLTGHKGASDQNAARGGGIVVPFPGQHCGRGIVANDDFYPEPQQARASGGGTSVSLQPGAYAGSPTVPMLGTGSGITGSASVPMLPVSTGSHTSSTNTNLSNYLASVTAGASSAPPPSAPKAPATSAAAPITPTTLTDINSGGDGGGGGSGMQRGGGIMRRADGGDTGPTIDLASADEPIIADAGPTITTPDMGSGSGIGAGGGGGHSHHIDPSILAGPLPGGDDDVSAGNPLLGGAAGGTSTGGSGIVPHSDIDASPPPSGHSDHASGHGLDPWLTLTAAGLGIMGGTSPHALTNIGRGAMEGLQFGEQQAQRQDAADLRRTQQEQNDLYRQGVLADKSRGRDIQSDRASTYAMLSQASASQKMAAAALESARAAAVGAGHATEGDILSGAVASLTGQPNPDNDNKPFTRADALMHIKGVDSLAAHRQNQDDNTATRNQNTADYQAGVLAIRGRETDLRAQGLDERTARDQATAEFQQGRLRIGQQNADTNASRAAAVKEFNDRKTALMAQGLDERTAHDKAMVDLGYARAAESGVVGTRNQVTGRPTTTAGDVARDLRSLPTGGGQPQQPAASAPQFQNGKVYQDANGNRATYQNGQWAPVQ